MASGRPPGGTTRSNIAEQLLIVVSGEEKALSRALPQAQPKLTTADYACLPPALQNAPAMLLSMFKHA